MTRVALAISPHLDDAAFSAGAMLAGLARDGWRVLVATVFTGNVARPTGFALECQTSKGVPPDVDYMALRREEDRNACAALGAEPVHLPLLEAPHRGYEDALALFGPVRADDAAWSTVPDAIIALLRDLEPDLLLAPRAIGGHVDHVVVHDAVRALLGSVEILWWRDWPYHDRADAPDPFGAALLHSPEHIGPDDEPVRAAKRTACHAYGSQLPFQFGGPDALDARLASAPAERFAVAVSQSRNGAARRQSASRLFTPSLS